MKEKPRGRGEMAKLYDNAIERAICNGDGSADADDILLAIKEMTGLDVERQPLYAHISRRKKVGMIIANPKKYGSYMLANELRAKGAEDGTSGEAAPLQE